jgi:prophage antirepressor-like protein
MNELMNFDYDERPVRVIRDETGAPWWVVVDVCEILGLVNPSVAIEGLDEDEVNTLRKGEGILGPGNPNVNVINESGLYTLIIRSKKPEAKSFRKWITSEVLPAIRMNGYYEAVPGSIPHTDGTATISVARLTETAQGIKAAMIIARAFGFRDEEARRLANGVVKKITGVDALELLGVSKEAEGNGIFDDFLEECCRVGEALRSQSSKLYGRFAQWCRDAGIDQAPTLKAFGRFMTGQFNKTKINGLVFYEGIGLS